MFGIRFGLTMLAAGGLGVVTPNCSFPFSSTYSPLNSVTQSSTAIQVLIDSNWGAGHDTVGDTITTVATASGGTPPYTYFWSWDGAAWVVGGSSYTVTASSSGYHTVDVVVRDSNGRDSDDYAIANIYIEAAASSASSTGDGSSGGVTAGTSTTSTDGQTTSVDCNSPQGATYNSTWGELALSVSGSNNGGTSPVSGSYTYQHGVFSGTLNWSTQVITGTWTETYDNGTQSGTGAFEWTFSGDWKSFSGSWRWSSSNNWVGNWNGWRSSCD